jgi:hypothetical protein
VGYPLQIGYRGMFVFSVLYGKYNVLRALVPNYSLVVISTSFGLCLASDAPNSARSHHGRSPPRAYFASHTMEVITLQYNSGEDEQWLVYCVRSVLLAVCGALPRPLPAGLARASAASAHASVPSLRKLARNLFLPISGSTYEFLHYQRAHDHL